MAHFAKLDADNNVLEVIVISDNDVGNLPFPESEPIGVAFCKSLFGEDTNWRQTSYNSSFRRQYASLGGFYYPALDVFVAAKNYPSWSFNPQIGNWEAPVPKPEAPANYVAVWDEENLEWDIILDTESI